MIKMPRTYEWEYDPFGKDFEAHQTAVMRGMLLNEYREKSEEFKKNTPSMVFVKSKLKTWRAKTLRPMLKSKSWQPVRKVNQYLIPQEYTFNDYKLPCVYVEDEPWFISLPALEVLGIRYDQFKRTDIPAEYKRRDQNVEGMKRPSLFNLGALELLVSKTAKNS